MKVINVFFGTAVDDVTAFVFSKNVAYHTLLCLWYWRVEEEKGNL